MPRGGGEEEEAEEEARGRHRRVVRSVAVCIERLLLSLREM